MSKETNIDTIVINNVEYIRNDQFVVNKERKGAWIIGEKYIIRTVTMMHTGILAYLDDKELVLSNASWIADSGRFHDALKTGKLNEVEPFPDEAIVGRGAIVDAAIWLHDLPRTQK